MSYPFKNLNELDNKHLNSNVKRGIYTSKSSADIFSFIDYCFRSLNYLENEGFEIDVLYYQRLSEFYTMVSSKLIVEDYYNYQKIKSY